MRDRVMTAVQEGILLGVKWGIVALLTCGGASYAIGDYALTRAKASQGADAFNFIQQQIAAQQAQAKAPATEQKLQTVP